MAVEFWKAAFGFHAGMLPLTLWLGWRWRQRLKRPLSAGRWWLAAAADVVLFGAGALALAAAAAAFAPWPMWSGLRFLCQALFGWGVLLTLFVAALHYRGGFRRRALPPALAAALLLLVYAEAYRFGPYRLQVRHYTVDLTGGRPEAGRLRIAHLSDLQTHRVGRYEERVFRAVQRLDADMIVLTGDYVQPRLAPDARAAGEALNALLRRMALAPPLGFFVTQGDTETPGEWEWLFAGTGAALLVDEHRVLELPGGRSLVLTGLSSPVSSDSWPRGARRVFGSVPAGDLHLVLGHNPDFVRLLAEEGPRIDLALAGHTHGGQVVLPFFGPPITFSRLPRRFAGGLNAYEGIPLHVSRGIGMERRTAPQIRFLCPPEICVLEIRY